MLFILMLYIDSNYAHFKTAMSSDFIPTQHKLNTRRCKVTELSGCKATRKKEAESTLIISIAVNFAVSWALNILIFHSCSFHLININKQTNNLSLCFNLEGT